MCLLEETSEQDDTESASSSANELLFTEEPDVLPETNCKTDIINQKETETELLSTTENEPLNASTEDPDDAVIKRMLELLPVVMKNLSIEGKDSTMLEFFELVEEDKFSLTNIAYLLWNEVVRWFQCTSTTQMRYSKETKTFWKLGWQIFGTRVVNFMGGYKSHRDTVLKLSDLGNYSPESSEINFAVPSLQQLRDFDPYGIEGERKPGIYSDIIDTLSTNLQNKSAFLTFDGKKIKQALSTDSGDVDLLGFEKSMSLKDKQIKLEQKLLKVSGLIETVLHTTSLSNTENVKEQITSLMQ